MSNLDNAPLPDTICLPEDAYLFNRITYYLNGKKMTCDIPPGMSILDYLHNEMGLYGTKCSCNEGDCGACTVVVASWDGRDFTYQAINSCIYPAAKLHGKHLITVEGIGTTQNLHPIQKAMLDHHATQCGYCTPGFVMSIFAYLAGGGSNDRESILSALEGNLCRCTGYDALMRTVCELTDMNNADQIIPEWCRQTENALYSFNDRAQLIHTRSTRLHPVKAYIMPQTLAELFEKIRNLDDHSSYRFICGGTDLMVQANVNKIYFPYLLDISLIEELHGISEHDGIIEIGAAVTYSQIRHSKLILAKIPVLIKIINQIASEQIRNSATLIGNIGNASPIGDASTTLLALDARLRIVSHEAERYLPLAQFFLDYKKTALDKGEIIHSVIIPSNELTDFATVIKSAKRKAVDISSIVTAAFFRLEDGVIKEARMAVGGADRFPRVSLTFGGYCKGKDIGGDWFEEAAGLTALDFAPINDVRGSREFRSRMIRNHALLCLQRCRDHFTGGAQ